MHAFDYQRPATLKDAAAFLKKNENARILSGGQSLLPTLKMRLAQASALVDVNAIAELRAVKLEAAVLTVGAGLRHSEVATHKDVLIGIPALARVASGIGDRQVRNMGTLGGSLANNDPAADYPAAVLGLGATIHTNRRAIVADKFFTGLYETFCLGRRVRQRRRRQRARSRHRRRERRVSRQGYGKKARRKIRA
jgi:carbon-monoxide dehydrogenase medium subunit